MSSPVYVALDTIDLDHAKAVAAAVRNHLGGIQLGLEFFTANGRAGVREMDKLDLPIFLDLKLHDIPNTVAMAIQALRPLDPSIITIPPSGGRADRKSVVEGTSASERVELGGRRNSTQQHTHNNTQKKTHS